MKAGKSLQEAVRAPSVEDSIYDILDDLVIKAFKVVNRAVRFFDIWSQDINDRFPARYASEVARPLTPPADSQEVTPQHLHSQSTLVAKSSSSASLHKRDVVSPLTPGTASAVECMPVSPRSSSNHASKHSLDAPQLEASLSSPQKPMRQRCSQTKRPSTSHRWSYTGTAVGLRRHSLASERLGAAHDSFLGFIASFIGLHLQSRSSSEVVLFTRQSVTACQQLLSVVEEVLDRDLRRCETLKQTRDAMYARLSELIRATKEIFSLSRIGNEEVMPPDQRKQLVDAAMSCVRSAGECVNKTRFVIEKIGDFEVDSIGLGISGSIFDGVANAVATQITDALDKSASSDTQQAPSPPSQPRSRPPAPPLILTEGSPLPDSPTLSPTAILAPNAPTSLVESPVALSSRTSTSSIPSLSNFILPHLPPPHYSPTNPTHSPETVTRRFFGQKPRADSVNVSNADSNSTYPSSLPGDGASIISHTSTRATTPEQSSPKRHEEPALLSSFGSASELHSIASEDCRRFEAEMSTKTYACELVYNKDGQICGGSLPALVEKLTAHESTPDAIFLTTFYLTFRLFTTPIDFAKCLVDRFEYVGESEEIGVPVRLRVYNVFKGWLESHWQADSDSPALGVILAFATGQLRAALPAAGRRLAELTVRVTEVHAASLVPQLVSSMGKTSTSSTVWSATEGSAPSPIITRSQLNALRNARGSGLQPSILDFDPLELARQFTIIESKIFNAIQPEELLGSEWTKKTDSKATNVRAMARLSTDLANLVADTILSLEDPKKRAVVIKQWVKIAMRCLELNNYDSLMAIICSLNSSMVLRLKRTWDIVSQKTKTRLEDLRTVVDVGRNYAVLRQRLQNHVAPCIPFVGIYLTDLTFVDVGNTTTRQLPADGSGEGVSVINFDKHVRTAKIIGQLQRFQVSYKLSPIPEMQEWMERQILRVRSSDQANVQSYYRRSLVLEPRETQQAQLQPTLGDSATSTYSINSRETAKEKFDFFGNFQILK